MSSAASKNQPVSWKARALYGLAFLLFVPVAAYLSMLDRKEKEAGTVEFLVGEGVHVVLGRDSFLGDVRYQDGTTVKRAALGVVLVGWAEHRKQADVLDRGTCKLAEEDFPVVVFFNRSGFDPTGEAVQVRRAKDGKVLCDWGPDIRPVRLVLPRPDGDFAVVEADVLPAAKPVSQDHWYLDYMGQLPAAPPPPPMPPVPPVEPMRKVTLKGRVLKLDLKPFEQGGVLVFGPDVKPFARPVEQERPLASSVLGPDGSYVLSLPPGPYQLAAHDQLMNLYGPAAGGWFKLTVADQEGLTLVFDLRTAVR